MSEESVNIPETAEQDTQSAEMPEVAEQAQGTEIENGEIQNDSQNDNTVEETERDFEKDEAYAKMRRESEAARQEAEELREQIAQQEAERREAETEHKKESEIDALKRFGEEQGLSESEIDEIINDRVAEIDNEAKIAELEAKNRELELQYAETAADRIIASDLEAIRKIDPSIKGLEDLGENFTAIRNAVDEDNEYFLTPEQAYYATKALEGKLEEQKPKAPQPPGMIATGSPDKTFFTKEEVENMSQEDVTKNLDAIQNSMKSWGQ